MRRLAALIVLLSALALTGRAQSPSVLHGRVVSAETGTPLHNARVEPRIGDKADAPVFTNSDGRFSLTRAASALLTLSVAKAGYLASTTRAAGDDVEIRLTRAGAISGRIVDAAGEPLTGMTVEAQIPGADGVVTSDLKTVATGLVDDLGDYRIAGLPAGAYVVSVIALSPIMMPGGNLLNPVNGPIRAVTVVNGQPVSSETSAKSTRTYYGGTTTPQDVQIVVLATGEERTAIDFVAARERIVEFPAMARPRAGRGPAPTYTGGIRGARWLASMAVRSHRSSCGSSPTTTLLCRRLRSPMRPATTPSTSCRR